MAKIYPSKNVSFINESEEEFYNFLKDSKETSNWTVFYSHRLITEKYLKEIDFILLIPCLGISFIELKANNPIKITQDSFTYNYSGKIVEKENPFRRMKNIISQFKTIFRTPNKNLDKLFVSYLIIFSNYNDFFDERICFSPTNNNYINSFTKKENLVQRILELHKQQNESTRRLHQDLNENEINQILKEFEKSLRYEFKINEKNILNEIELEKKNLPRKNLLNTYTMLTNLKKAFFIGPAKTGKTFLAIEHLKKISNLGKTIYFCFNPIISENLKRDFSFSENIEIYNYLDFLKTKSNILEKDFSEEKAIKNILGKTNLSNYNFIIAEQTENYLSIDFLNLINHLLKDKIDKGGFWLFYDNINISKEEEIKLKEIYEKYNLNDCKINLSLNYGLPKNFSSLIETILGENIYETSLIHNSGIIEKIIYENNQKEVLEELLTNLSFNYSPRDISIISVKSNKNSISHFMSENKRGWGKKLIKIFKEKEGFISYGNINQFWGIEKKIIIVTDMDKQFYQDIEANKILYKIISRAQSKIIFLIEKNLDEDLKNKINQFANDSILK